MYRTLAYVAWRRPSGFSIQKGDFRIREGGRTFNKTPPRIKKQPNRPKLTMTECLPIMSGSRSFQCMPREDDARSRACISRSTGWTTTQKQCVAQ
ncbi:hypothetical protein CEXT_722491 [Caerostris extrusa]|uniref:Uncharacterized protein n=1 Tax=Caerostris extrusa TaxID=172846 RepID=A0AAV4RHC4_CAEEX|nr:hypothetical protein CEXT_722491 [Caerostris extrusa]